MLIILVDLHLFIHFLNMTKLTLHIKVVIKLAVGIFNYFTY